MKKQLKQMALFAAMLLWLLSGSSAAYGSTGNDPSKEYSENIAEQKTVLNIGSRLELFVDDYLIDHLGGNAQLRLHHPEPQEIVITFDEPWEGNSGAYRSIFYDGIRYRMYYNTSYTCYAESHDGINWYKPNLGLYEFQGSKENNIVFISGLLGGVNIDGIHLAVFMDENPNVSPGEKYKAIMVVRGEGRREGLIALKSPDGINWAPMTDHPVITDGGFGSQNLAFWDGERGEYRAYWRYDEYPEGKRLRFIRTARSEDMINWYDHQDLVYSDSPPEGIPPHSIQMYTNVIKPYYRAPHIFIGFPTRYIDRGWSESMRALPDIEDREFRSGKSPRAGTALTESMLMTSRDGVLFNRWNETFLRPGIERPGTWDYGHLYISWSVVETKSSLKGAPNELSFYAGENYRTTTDNFAVRRYSLRKDGFVSVNAPMSGGELVTKPLTFTGNNLILNFSTSAAGGIKVEIQDERGIPLPGYSLDDCPPVFGDTIERVVTWENGSDLSSLEGKPVRLRFVLNDADLYSLRFH